LSREIQVLSPELYVLSPKSDKCCHERCNCCRRSYKCGHQRLISVPMVTTSSSYYHSFYSLFYYYHYFYRTWVARRVSNKKQELFALCEGLGSPPFFILYCGVRIAHLFNVLLCCVVVFCYVCLCLVSCVPNVASVSGLSIFDWQIFWR
jgi:hypothetical protein